MFKTSENCTNKTIYKRSYHNKYLYSNLIQIKGKLAIYWKKTNSKMTNKSGISCKHTAQTIIAGAYNSNILNSSIC